MPAKVFQELRRLVNELSVPVAAQAGFLQRLNGPQQLLLAPASSVRGISDRGRMVGTVLVDQPATFRDVFSFVALGMPAGATSGRANGVNRCGHAVGAVYAPGGGQATFWQINACD